MDVVWDRLGSADQMLGAERVLHRRFMETMHTLTIWFWCANANEKQNKNAPAHPVEGGLLIN